MAKKKTAKQLAWKKIYSLEEAKKFAGVENPLGSNNKGELRKIWPVDGQEKKGENQKKYYWASRIPGLDPNSLKKPTISKKKKNKKQFA